MSQTRLMLATNELTQVRRLFASSSLHRNSTSKYVTAVSVGRTTIVLTIDVFLFLVSENAGSTSIVFLAVSAYF